MQVTELTSDILWEVHKQCKSGMITRLIGSQVRSGRVMEQVRKTVNTQCTVEFVESNPWDHNE